MCNTFKGAILVKIGTLILKKSKNWYRYAKDKYFLDKVTSGL